MIKLLMTHDGMFGVKNDYGTKWFNSWRRAASYMFIAFDTPLRDVELAIKYMLEKNHTAADFGIFGGFIMTIDEVQNHETWN